MHFKISCSAWGHSSRDVETCHMTWLLAATSGALSPSTALFQILQRKWTFSVSLDSRQQHFHRCRWVWVEIHLLCLSIVKRLPNSYRPSSLHGGSLSIESVLWFFLIAPPPHSLPNTHTTHFTLNLPTNFLPFWFPHPRINWVIVSPSPWDRTWDIRGTE